jgi:hypothetical protein
MSASPTAPPRSAKGAWLPGPGCETVERLGAYTDPDGRERELLAVPAARASTLVIDRLASSGADPRLIAHLGADEPAQNAGIVAALYLADARGRRCRPVQAEDFQSEALPAEESLVAMRHLVAEELRDAHRLELATNAWSIPELRWCRREPTGAAVTVTMRSAIASLESYEPVRGLSEEAIEHHRADPCISIAVLRRELERVCESPIVLNRGLREAVLQAVHGGDVTMSEIAIRCGRVKRDHNGHVSGETSWLARRIGTLPEPGQSAPTPWVHTDVLALIAREGLGIAPREVELT